MSTRDDDAGKTVKKPLHDDLQQDGPEDESETDTTELFGEQATEEE
ncbi:hypothetical protein [Streptomyces sp. WAC07149]|nr:hypothetical protein [Streptomyces sp. WAC07149]